MLIPWKPDTAPGFLISGPIPLEIGVLMAGRDVIYDKSKEGYMIRRRKGKPHAGHCPGLGFKKKFKLKPS